MKVVMNSGPLICLSKINVLYVLEELYEQIIIPYEVYQEVIIDGLKAGKDDAKTASIFLKNSSKIKIIDTKTSIIEGVRDNRVLGAGEKAAISAAKDENCLLLIDDFNARRVANSLNIKIKGSIGVLVEAFRRSIINQRQLKYLLTEIGERKDIWISERLCNEVIAQLGINQ